MPQDMVNMAWNIAEWMNGQKRPVDILWLYAGYVNNSLMFNIVSYVFGRMELIN